MKQPKSWADVVYSIAEDVALIIIILIALRAFGVEGF